MWLSVLPWGFLVLGLSPLWMFPRQENLYPGVIFLLSALLFAATASLFARISANPKTNFAWVLGLSLIGMVLAVEAARDLAQLPEEIATAAALASMIASGLFLAGLYFTLKQPTQEEGETSKSFVDRRKQPRQILTASALDSLAPSLEAMASVRPVTLLLLHTRPEQLGEELLNHVRSPDLIFQLKDDQFLIALQGSSTEGAQIVFRRIRQNMLIRAYAVLPLHGSTVQRALYQLEGELNHYYLTQH
jgi:hypothetical protein